MRHSRRLRRLCAGAMASIASLALAATATAASPTKCDGTLDPGNYGSIIVPSGASCTLIASVVTGDVVVNPGAISIDALYDAIGGSFISHGATTELIGIAVDHNLTITGASASVDIEGSAVAGGADVVNNGGISVTVEGSSFFGNVKVNNNDASSSNSITENAFHKNLICENNRPAPTVTDNALDHKANGQCAS